jgi:VCBS repeat-containing protein
MGYDVDGDGLLSPADLADVLWALDEITNATDATHAGDEWLDKSPGEEYPFGAGNLGLLPALASSSAADGDDPCALPPTVSVVGGTVDEGNLFSPEIIAGGGCPQEYRIDWGDGNLDLYTLTDPFGPTHVYADDGLYTLIVLLFDQAGGSASAADIVHVTNVAPVAEPDTFTIHEREYDVVVNLLNNDRDVGRDDQPELVAIDTSETKGTVSDSGFGWITYNVYEQAQCLAEGETATDSFRYTIRDDEGATSTATVTIHIEGRRNVYSLHYVAGAAREEGSQPSTIYFRLVPTPICHPVTLSYGQIPPAAPYHVAPDQMASAADVDSTWGVVNFPQGVDQVEAKITPVDDEIIERNEWFFLKAHWDVTPDYRLFDMSDFALFKVYDDEWRFVSEAGASAPTMGPVPVEAFSSIVPPYTSLVSADISYSGTFHSGLGGTADSTAVPLATVNAKLTRSFDVTRSNHLAALTFVCDSQSGDIWHRNLEDVGNFQVGPLSSVTELLFDIDDVSDEEGRIVVSLKTKVVAKGSLTKGTKGSLGISGGSGGQGKGPVSGGLEITSLMTYEGGVAMSRSEGYTFICTKGEKSSP